MSETIVLELVMHAVRLAWIDAAGQIYADYLASVTEAQQLAANLGTAYTPGPVPAFTAPGG